MKNYMFILLYLFCIQNSQAQLTEIWNFQYSFIGNADVNHIKLSKDGNNVYIAATISSDQNGFFSDEALFKISVDSGNLVWKATQKLTGITNGETVIDFIEGSNEKIYSIGFSNKKRDFLIARKINANGQLEWAQIIPDTNLLLDTEVNKFLLDNEENMIITIQTQDTLRLVKIDSTGQIEFNKPLLAKGICNSIKKDNEGNFYIGGDVTIGTGLNAKKHLLLIKTNKNGELIWNKTIDNGTDFNYYRILEMEVINDKILGVSHRYRYATNSAIESFAFDTTGNFLWTTIDSSFTVGTSIGYTIKEESILFGKFHYPNIPIGVKQVTLIDNMGQLIKENNIDTEINYTFMSTDKVDNAYCIYSLNQTNSPRYLRKLNNNLETDWDYNLPLYSYGENGTGNKPNIISPFAFDDSLNVYLFGRQYILDSINLDPQCILHVFKYKQDSLSNQVNNIIKNYSSINVYPNPATNEIKIKSEEHNIERITIYDITGKSLSSPPLQEGVGGGFYNMLARDEIIVNISYLPQGIYYYQVMLSNEEMARGKIVKQ